MPVITRLQNPESLGRYQLFSTVALMVTPFVTGSFQYAIMSSKSRHKALLNLKLAMQYSLVCSIILLIIFFIIYPFLIATEFEWFAIYLPLLVFFVYLSANFQFTMAYLTNNKSYGVQSSYSLTKSAISNTLKLVFSYFSKTSFSLIFAIVLTEFFQILRLLSNSHKSVLRFIFKIKLKKLKNDIIKQHRFPTYVTFSAILGILMNWFPIIVTGIFYGPEYAGLLGLSFMVVNTPVYPFISALRNVCFGELARDFSFKKCISVCCKIFLMALLPSIAGILILWLYGEDLFSFIFSEEWRISGFYAYICFYPIALSLLLSPIYSTLNHLFNFQRLFFFINLIVLTIGISLTAYIGFTGSNFIKFIIFFSFTMSINHILLFIFSIYFSIKKSSL